jgi:WD40 repeat protein
MTGQLALITNFKDRIDYSMKRFQGFHDGPVNCISWSSSFTSGILSGGVDSVVKLWNATDGTCRRNLTGAQSKVCCHYTDFRLHISVLIVNIIYLLLLRMDMY